MTNKAMAPQWRIVLHSISTFALGIFTCCYAGNLHHYTRDPICMIAEYQHNEQMLLKALREFRRRKEEESAFVRNASTLSAAAAIGVFSWSSLNKTFWLAKVFWIWTLIAAIFSLISSAQQRLLSELPREEEHKNSARNMPSRVNFEGERVSRPCFGACSEIGKDVPSMKEMEAVLDLMLTLPRQSNSIPKGKRMESWLMIWVWQSSTMLMSYSWMLFLAGYALHILSPIIEGPERSRSDDNPPVVCITFGVCLLMLLNFVLCAAVSHRRLLRVRKTRVGLMVSV